jgi:hypothetical protein
MHLNSHARHAIGSHIAGHLSGILIEHPPPQMAELVLRLQEMDPSLPVHLLTAFMQAFSAPEKFELAEVDGEIFIRMIEARSTVSQ